MTFLARQESTKSRKLSDQLSPAARDGESFCAMWYKALIAFMLNSGGRLSAVQQQQITATGDEAPVRQCFLV